MKEKKQTKIQIAGHTFTINDHGEAAETLRKVEHEVNKTWAKWCNDYNNQNTQGVLAMVAFQYARLYYKMLDNMNANERAITDFEQKLDEILLNVN